MQPQMEAGEPIHEQPGAAYGAYSGGQGYTQQRYDTPYSQPGQNGSYDDNFVEALAQRIAQRTVQGASGKAYSQDRNRNIASSGQRLALAIVSVVMLVGIAGICLGPGSSAGLMGFVAACAAIFLINAVFNMAHKW